MWFNNLAAKAPNYYTALGINTAGQAMQEGPAATNWRNRLANGPADPTNTTVPPTRPPSPRPSGSAFVGMRPWLFDQIAI